MLDRRAIFALVLLFTLVSTLAVAGVCMWSVQTPVMTAMYSLGTMWLVGIISQVLLHNLYQSIVKPLEEQRIEERRIAAQAELNLSEVEAIDEANTKIDQAHKRVRAIEKDAESLLTRDSGS